MRSLGDVLERGIKERQGKLTAKQRTLCDEFYGYIADWKAGILDAEDVEVLTGSGYVVFRIVSVTSFGHPLYDDIMRWLDVLIKKRRGPGVVLNHLWYSERMIKSAGGRIVEVPNIETGEIDLAAVWPSSYGKTPDGKPDLTNPIFGRYPLIREPYDLEKETRKHRPDGWAIWGNDDPDEMQGVDAND